MSSKTILVTGGAGYIGSHCVVELLNEGFEVVVVDNLSNSHYLAIQRIEQITGKKVKQFYQIDIRNEQELEKVFKEHTFHSVVHFAGLKAVGESVAVPLTYYENNVFGSMVLFKLMSRYNVKNVVFSSSATVYGTNDVPPSGLTEDMTTGATNPYGRTKLFIEEILQDLYVSDKEWNIVLLRYFNPAGAHPSGLIGEDPRGIPNNLMPFINQVCIGKLEKVKVFGGDYPTKDGTGVRDYIHVVDLAKGHIAAVRKIDSKPGCVIYNLGTGIGYSVLEMVHAMEKAVGKSIPYTIVDRRPGDIAICFASPTKAKEELRWVAELGVDRMCQDSWNWQQKNPNGYLQS
mmetsp:Transcript_2439/g.3202  ORF Transcript_2439/g.3202 Transcript_2439/m.3202 type:complete len:345 (-) Transcript_2439:43-1077(-)